MAAKKTITRKIGGATVETDAPKEKESKEPLPAQAREHPTLKAWLENEKHRERLKEILTDPVFIAANAYAQELFRVKSSDLTGPKAMLDLEVVRKSSIHSGVVEYHHILKTFLVISDPTTQLPPAWEHILPKND